LAAFDDPSAGRGVSTGGVSIAVAAIGDPPAGPGASLASEICELSSEIDEGDTSGAELASSDDAETDDGWLGSLTLSIAGPPS
jgi:hypothetical protein